MGSSTWTQHLLNIRGLDKKYIEFERSFITNNYPNNPNNPNGHNARGLMRETMYHKPSYISLQEVNAMLVTFAFTRHPFNRLVSAYNDKIKHMKWNVPHELRVGIDKDIIVMRNYIMESVRNVDPKKTNDYPSPKEFVTYLLQQVEIKGPFILNWHWRPQFASCPFCAIDFDYVGEIKDMNAHVDFLSDILGFKVYLKHNFTLTISAQYNSSNKEYR